MSALVTTILAGATAVICSRLWLNIAIFIDPNDIN
mgnify:FL=1